MAIFNYALTPAQLQQLASAGVTGVSPVTLSIQRSGGNLILTWPRGTLLEADNVTGPFVTTSATSPYLIAPTATQKFYRVQVQ